MPRQRSSLPIIVAGIAACGYIPAPAFAQAEFADSELSAAEGFDNSDGMVGFAGIEGLGTKVADEDLSQMRGKFATPNGIGYFGLEMSTSWQTPDGITTQARLAINFDFAGSGAGGNPTPQVFVSWQRDEGEETLDVRSFGQQAQGGYVALTTSGAVPVGGLDTVHGAVQSQQIAGDDNSVRNAMTVAIVPLAECADQYRRHDAIERQQRADFRRWRHAEICRERQGSRHRVDRQRHGRGQPEGKLGGQPARPACAHQQRRQRHRQPHEPDDRSGSSGACQSQQREQPAQRDAGQWLLTASHEETTSDS